MKSIQYLMVVGSMDGGDEVLVLLEPGCTHDHAIDLALTTDAEFIGPITVVMVALQEIHHLEAMRPYVSHCADLPLEVPDWVPEPRRNQPVATQDPDFPYFGEISFTANLNAYSHVEIDIIRLLGARLARLLEDRRFEPEGYLEGGTLDIERDAQARPTRLTFTLHYDMFYDLEEA